MSVHAISYVLKHSAAEGTERTVLLVLANYANDEWQSWPSIETIAWETNCSPRQAQRHLRALLDAGRINMELQAAPDSRIPKDHRPNLYTITKTIERVRGDIGDTPNGGDIQGRGVTSKAEGGDIQGKKGVTSMSPKPSLDPSQNLFGEPTSENASKSRPSKPLPAAKKQPNPIRQLFVDELGEPTTRATAVQWNIALKDIAAIPNVTVEMVATAISTARRKWSKSMTPSPMAVARQWDTLMRQAPKRGQAETNIGDAATSVGRNPWYTPLEEGWDADMTAEERKRFLDETYGGEKSAVAGGILPEPKAS